jgi:FKBP-type peptidyl-prolyl cis-trans isomerase
MKDIHFRSSIIYAVVLAGILPFLVSGCLNNEWQQKEDHENELIKNYLKENGITEDQKTEGGIYYVELVPGTGQSPVLNDYVVINYVGRYIENNIILETSYDSLKDDWPLADSYEYYLFGPLKIKFGYSITGLNEGLSLMKEGGKSLLVIPSDKAFYDFNPMTYEVELIKVIKDPVAYEDSVLNEYLTLKGFDTTTFYRNIYFKETFTPDPGDERTVGPNDTVLMRFTGRLVDGFSGQLADNRVFDTNTDDDNPLKMVFDKAVISGKILAIPDGLKIAIDSMRVGTHATAILPYEEAFGDDGLYSGTYGYSIVPKYQTVVYDLIVEDIRPGPGK